MERLQRTAAPNGTGLWARGIGSPTQPVVAAQGAPAQDGHSQWHGPTRQGNGESYAAGCRSSSSCGGWQLLMERAHVLGGQGVLPTPSSQLRERLRRMAAPNGADP